MLQLHPWREVGSEHVLGLHQKHEALHPSVSFTFSKCKFGSSYHSWLQQFAFLHYYVEKHAVLCQVLSFGAMPFQVL